MLQTMNVDFEICVLTREGLIKDQVVLWEAWQDLVFFELDPY